MIESEEHFCMWKKIDLYIFYKRNVLYICVLTRTDVTHTLDMYVLKSRRGTIGC